MCAAARLSLVSPGVWVVVTSMLLMVAVKVIDVGDDAELKRNRAVPKEAGRGPPPDAVGTVGGTSWPLLNVAVINLTLGGSIPAVVSSESTYCVFVMELNLSTNSGRVTKSLKYATLFASSCASNEGVPKTKSFCSC